MNNNDLITALSSDDNTISDLTLSNEFVLIPSKQYDITIVVMTDTTRTQIDLYFKNIPSDAIIQQLNVLGGCDDIYVDTIDTLDDDKYTPDALYVVNNVLNQFDEEQYKKEWFIDISPLYDEYEIIDKVIRYFTTIFGADNILVKYKNRPNDNEFAPVLI